MAGGNIYKVFDIWFSLFFIIMCSRAVLCNLDTAFQFTERSFDIIFHPTKTLGVHELSGYLTLVKRENNRDSSQVPLVINVLQEHVTCFEGVLSNRTTILHKFPNAPPSGGYLEALSSSGIGKAITREELT